MRFKRANNSSVSKSKTLLGVTVLICCTVLAPRIPHAESTEQIWLEYSPSYSFRDDYKLGMRGSYRTTLEEPHWRTIEIRFMPEKKLNKHFDLLASLQFLDTRQYREITTAEVRPAVGARWHFLPGKRVSSGIMATAEFRNVYHNEGKEWTYTTRARLKVFGSMPLNSKTMSPDRVFYATSFVEFFLQNDE